MGKTKAVVAVLAPGLALFGLAVAPAGAETARAQQQASFTFGGRSLTCSFSGWSEWDQDEFSGPVTQVDFGTDVVDGDRRCAKSLAEVSATLTYRRSGASEDEYSTASGPGPSTSGEVIVRDALERAVVTHTVLFRCDEVPAPGTCQFNVSTDPIAVNAK